MEILGLATEALSEQITLHGYVLFSAILVSAMTGLFAWQNNFFRLDLLGETSIEIRGKDVLRAFFTLLSFKWCLLRYCFLP